MTNWTPEDDAWAREQAIKRCRFPGYHARNPDTICAGCGVMAAAIRAGVERGREQGREAQKEECACWAVDAAKGAIYDAHDELERIGALLHAQPPSPDQCTFVSKLTGKRCLLDDGHKSAHQVC